MRTTTLKLDGIRATSSIRSRCPVLNRIRIELCVECNCIKGLNDDDVCVDCAVKSCKVKSGG